jgi:hypothetical protein
MMNPLTVAFVSALTALSAAILSPLVSLFVARMQIRAAVVSNNRERWIETLRDAVSEYVALLLTASIVKEGIEGDLAKEVSEHPDLRQIVERIVMMKSKIMLMVNPRDRHYAELCEKLAASYESLTSGASISVSMMRSQADEITQAGRDALRMEWARVKRGD